ncbi:hypothetical protein FRC12_013382 [Ceratobasidium sp. 428]|nr:hypothetical protein FRC12_013382 [Ceratobasidium sp. 428]
MRGSNSLVREVTQMFPKSLDSEWDIPQTTIFVNKRGLAFRMMDVLRKFLPLELRSQFKVYRTQRSQLAKGLTAKDSGEENQGCGFKRIEQAILFKVLGPPAAVLQCGGHNGRGKSIAARAVMMVEVSKRAQGIADVGAGIDGR